MAKAATKKAPKAKTEQSHVIEFNLSKETKGALRYEEEGFDEKNMEATLVGTLYVRKSQIVGDEYPQTLTVSITYEV